jgi:hypothetical protein
MALGVPWLVYISPGASNNPPNRHSKLEVQNKFLSFITLIAKKFPDIAYHLNYFAENI